jgi:hypothetical protein
VATALGDAGKIAEASRQLGHASEEVTLSYYIAKPKLAPDVTAVLETLGASPPVVQTLCAAGAGRFR